MESSSTTTLLFESGIMKISDYDPIHDRYLTRTLQLPSFPLFSNLDLPFSDPTPKLEKITISSPVNNEKKLQTTAMSRFIEYFELADTPPSSRYYNASSSTLRSSRSTSSKKTANSLFSTKAPRRCYSNPNLSKKNTMVMVESLEPTLQSVTLSSSRKVPKRSLSNAFHALTGLLPTKSKRRLNNDQKHYDQTKEDGSSRLSTCSSSSTIRMAWQGTTWLDEMKTSSDFGPRQRLASIDQARPWWTTTTTTAVAPLSSYNVCVNA